MAMLAYPQIWRVRLSNAFGSTPEMWLKLQMAYDLGQARQKDENQRVRKFAPA